jgi:hypothetical protein
MRDSQGMNHDANIIPFPVKPRSHPVDRFTFAPVTRDVLPLLKVAKGICQAEPHDVLRLKETFSEQMPDLVIDLEWAAEYLQALSDLAAQAGARIR